MNFEEMGIDAYPLCWPDGWKRKTSRGPSRFTTSFTVARDRLFRELKLMGVNNTYHIKRIVLSTNIPLRRDGLPLAGQSNPKDPGVAVYFQYKDKPMVFACDNYNKVEDNLYAITKTIEALRGIQRWGASDMMERSFTGFSALPPAQSTTNRPWWVVLDVDRGDDWQTVIEARNALARKYHPDHGGSIEKMQAINRAFEEARRERGAP